MKAKVEVEAAAKVNLSLRVLRKRKDGFHEIDSIMVRLPGLCDLLSFERAEEDGFSCDADGVPADESNLVIKALSVFRRETRMNLPLAIRLEKRVPHGAGLGGGSSDAAATLRALDRVHGTGLDGAKLWQMAEEIGSDVPFFLGPPVARVRGRGETVDPGPELPEMEVLLLKPGFGVSTPEAYGNWARSKELPGVDYRGRELEWGTLVNDLERPVFEKHLFLAEMKNWLSARDEVEAALMSGSGSTMFAILKKTGSGDALAKAAREELDPTLWSWSGAIGG